MKRQNSPQSTTNPFDLLTEEIVFSILDFLQPHPLSMKSFSLTCKSFYSLESRHRRTLKPLHSGHISSILTRYPKVATLDFTMCPRIPDAALQAAAATCGAALRSVDLSRSRFFTAAGLTALVSRCANLVEIDLSNATELKDSAAAALAGAKNLERLCLARCKLITDMGVGCIAVGCKKLRFISLKWCLGVGDLGVGLIAVKCTEIRSLDLSFLPVTSDCLSSILKLQYLEELSLEGCYGIDDDSLASLQQGSKSLKILDLASCQNISHKGLNSLMSETGTLQKLTLSYGPSVTQALADSLRRFSKLQSIKLDGCSVTCSGLEAIGSLCSSLRELSLSKVSGVTDEGICSLVKKQRELRKLDITCCRRITDVSIAHVTNSCSSLTSLRMESCTMVSREAFVLIGQRCPFLEELDLTDNEIDDEGLKSVSNCSSLTSLKLGICLNVTDEGLIHVSSSCSKLVELDLYRCVGIKDSSIVAIAGGCPDIEMINTSYCKDITDGSLIALSKCSKLNTFESRGCPCITSIGLVALAVGCRQLRKLDIKKCQNIDDVAMLTLAHFSQNLRQVNLSYTSVTDVGLLSLASISCLHNMTILDVKGLNPSGLAAALLACRGLSKAKLHASFKSCLPQVLFEHLEARGCIFQWREKEFQDELDAGCWKLRAEDLEL